MWDIFGKLAGLVVLDTDATGRLCVGRNGGGVCERFKSEYVVGDDLVHWGLLRMAQDDIGNEQIGSASSLIYCCASRGHGRTMLGE